MAVGANGKIFRFRFQVLQVNFIYYKIQNYIGFAEIYNKAELPFAIVLLFFDMPYANH